MNIKHRVYTATMLVGLTASLILTAMPAAARKNVFQTALEAFEKNTSSTVPGVGTVEVAFSPKEGGEALVVKVIESAKSDIRMLTYSFTSAPVVQALLDAKHRGVDIKIVCDFESNAAMGKKGEPKSPKSIAAMSTLVTAGADVRTISSYKIHHDKVILVDGKTTQTGSFNYSAAAASSNSENVLVNWGNPPLAKAYLSHFERNYRQSTPFHAPY